MKELALHILDIVQNSIRAEATIIEIIVEENTIKDILSIRIKDNGRGMDKTLIKKVEDPFFTTRTTRKIGLGISLLKFATLQSGGSFNIESKKGKGTMLTANFKHSHIDRAPLGRIDETIATLLMIEDKCEFVYTHYYNHKKFQLDSRDIKKALGEVSISNYRVINWVKEQIIKGLKDIKKS